MIRLFGSQGDAQRVQLTWDELTARLQPDTRAYNTYIEALISSQSPARARSAVHALGREKLFVANANMRSHARAQNNIYIDALISSQRPRARTLGCACIKFTKYDYLQLNHIQYMKFTTRVQPDTRAYNTIDFWAPTRAQLKNNTLSVAKAHVYIMLTIHMESLERQYLHIHSPSHIPAMVYIFEGANMQKGNSETLAHPDAYTAALALKLCQTDTEVEELITRTLPQWQITADLTLVHALLGDVSRRRALCDVLLPRVHAMLREHRLVPTQRTYDLLIGAYGRTRKTDIAISLFDEMKDKVMIFTNK